MAVSGVFFETDNISYKYLKCTFVKGGFGPFSGTILGVYCSWYITHNVTQVINNNLKMG